MQQPTPSPMILADKQTEVALLMSTLDYANPVGSHRFGRRQRLMLLLAIAYPLLLLGSLYGCWLAARFELGHWPRPSLDDPKGVGGVVDPLYAAFALFLFSWPVGAAVSVIICVYLLLGHFNRAAENRWRASSVLLGTACVLGAWGAMFVLLAWDPLGVLYWYMD